MKRSLSFVLALLIALSALSFASVASADTETWYVKTGNGKSLNVRDPNTLEVIGTLPYGSSVQVEFFDQNGWAVIIWGSYGEARVKASFLVSSKPGKYQGSSSDSDNTQVLSDSALGSETVEGMNKQYSTMKYVSSPYSVKVVPDTRTGTARLRWGPSKNSTLVTQLPANYELNVLASNSSWLMVEDPATGRIGYIAAKYTSAQ